MGGSHCKTAGGRNHSCRYSLRARNLSGSLCALFLAPKQQQGDLFFPHPWTLHRQTAASWCGEPVKDSAFCRKHPHILPVPN